jgi:hypothetical protein
MSSPEFAGLQGISGTAVAKRCALLGSSEKRELLLFIQGRSLDPGGLKKLVRELLEMFPKRIVCPDRGDIDWTFGGSDKLTSEECIQLALGRWRWPETDQEQPDVQSMEEFLIDLCINPRLLIRLKQGELEPSGFDIDLASHEFPEIDDRDFIVADLSYFRDIVGALVEYKRRYEDRARAEFCLTAIGRQIWEQLDAALKSKTMSVIDGREGRGKTEAVLAWCNCHLGVARFITLKGTNTKTAHFRKFAEAFGVGHGNSHKVSQMQANVEEVLAVSGLMPVIDEAHYFFNQSPRMKARPEMLDWIDTALCNPPLPVALITTPQFLICMERAADQVGWNYRQFRRRCKRYVRLPEKNTPEDIEAVARWLLPGADRATIKQVMGYEALSKRDLSAVGDVAKEAKLLAEEAGASRVTFEHVKRAIDGVLFPSDVPWAEMEKRLRERKQKRGRKSPWNTPAVAPAADRGPEEPEETPELETTPRRALGVSVGSRARFQEPVAVLVGDHG